MLGAYCGLAAWSYAVVGCRAAVYMVMVASSSSARFCLVLGDSAPYGVHIPTDQVIGELGLGLGFQDFTTHDLRKRGDKWKGNPQRHKIPLKESVVILKK